MPARSRSSRRSPRILALSLALLLLAPAAVATTVVRQSLESLSLQSDLVLRGVVERVELHDPEGAPPFQLAFVRVSDDASGASGAAPALVPVRLPGGRTASGLDCAVAGTPRLVPGDDLVLFLTRVPAHATARPTRAIAEVRGGAPPATSAQPPLQWQPVALSLGTWRVVAQPGGPVLRRDPDARGLHQVGEVTGRLPDGDDVSTVLRAVREMRAAGAPR